jgi:DNA end-binding protein Ku
MRSIWHGAISFGLVTVPVHMYTATESKELRFHFVTKDEMAPIGYDKVRKDTGEHVDPDDIVRAFEIEKGHFVPLEEEDYERLDIEMTRSIDICDFVDLDEIDPIYFRKGYWLLPDEGAEKPYLLLVRALEETGKVAIAKVVIRKKQHLAAIRVADGKLLLETMYFADEVRKPEQVKIKGALRDAEVEMAKTLVENLSEPFEIEKYNDTYRKELLDLLKAKAKGKKLPEPAEDEEPEVVDLMAALRESVQRTQRTRAAAKKKPAAASKKKTASRKRATRKAA